MSDYRLGRLKGRFVAVWYDAGKRRRWTLVADNPTEARAALREFASDRERLIRPPQRFTVAEIWADYVSEKQAEGKSISRQGDAWKRLAPVYRDLHPDDVTPGIVRSYTASRRQSGASDGTIHVELGYLRTALRKALKGKAPDIKLPSKPRPKSRHLTPEEARRLIDATRMSHVRLFILLALHTAGRPSSILGLRWELVDFSRRRINLDDPGRDRTAKGRAMVPIPDGLIAPLNEARAAALTTHVIEWAGKPVRSIKKGIQRAARRAALVDITPYVLRHTAAVWMAEGGVPMVEIAQMMGHNNPATTYRVYARFSPEHLRRASNAISTALLGPSQPVNGTENEPKGRK